jgi:hypothetical protein
VRKSAEIKLVTSIYAVVLGADFVGFTVYATFQSPDGFHDWPGLAKAAVAAIAFTFALTVLFVQPLPFWLGVVAFFGVGFTGGYLDNAFIGLSAPFIYLITAFLYWRIVNGAKTPDDVKPPAAR